MTQTVPQTTEATTPHWRGINHVALITTDMDATLRFYHGTLGARLVATIATPEFRHYFFEFGPQCTVAFFEYADTTIKPFTKSAGVPDPRAAQFDHLSLNLPDEDALIDLRNRVAGAGCEVTEIIDHGGVRSVYFTDPNGIALEASWWVHDSTGRPANYDDDRYFADPDPVAALRELQDTGHLTKVPITRLAQRRHTRRSDKRTVIQTSAAPDYIASDGWSSSMTWHVPFTGMSSNVAEPANRDTPRFGTTFSSGGRGARR